ncbi:MAG: HNH endonuclease [Deltaproteobacteria bacterium]|nr:HNH endonuclease [Deltaproteobacteria bacterium]
MLPENPGDGWSAFGQEQRAQDVVRVGNLTPIGGGLNRAVGAAGFERKREGVCAERVRADQGIGEEWTPERCGRGRRRWRRRPWGSGEWGRRGDWGGEWPR